MHHQRTVHILSPYHKTRRVVPSLKGAKRTLISRLEIIENEFGKEVANVLKRTDPKSLPENIRGLVNKIIGAVNQSPNWEISTKHMLPRLQRLLSQNTSEIKMDS